MKTNNYWLYCKDMKLKAEAQVLGAVTSISLTADGTYFFEGTSKSTIYWSDADTVNLWKYLNINRFNH